MGLITNAKTNLEPKTTQVNFPVLPQDFFVIVRLALENTNWEPDDLPLVKKTADDLKSLLEFTNKIRQLKNQPIASTAPNPEPAPVKIPPTPVDSATPPAEETPPTIPPVEKKN